MTEFPSKTTTENDPKRLVLNPGKGRGIAIIALLLMVTSTVCSGLMFGEWLESFERIAGSDQSFDSEEYAKKAGDETTLYLAGAVAGLLGGALIAWQLFAIGNRERWFLWSGLTVTLFQFVTFPFGPFMGIILLIGWVIRWREFAPRRPGTNFDSENS